MATYQDGSIWRKTLNAYLKRPNHMTGVAKTGDKQVHVQNDLSRGASDCPQNCTSNVNRLYL